LEGHYPYVTVRALVPLKGLAASGGSAVPCALLFTLAAALRLAGLSAAPLWTDERFSLTESQSVDRPPLAPSHVFDSSALRRGDGLLDVARASARLDQPAYIAFLIPWTRVFGVSEFWLRFPSAIAGAVTVPLVFLAGRRLVGASGAFLAALLVAVSPLHVDLSREARTYALSLALLVASLTVMIAAERHPSGIRAVLAGLLAGGAGVFHLLASTMLLPQAAWWAAKRPDGRRTLLAVAGVVLAWLAALPIGIRQSVLTAHRDSGLALQHPPPEEREWARPTTPFTLASAAAHAATRLVGLEPDSFGLRTRHVAWATVVLLALAGLGARGLDRSQRALVVGGALTPFLASAALAIGYGHVVSFESRYLLWALPCLALLIARGALGVGRRLVGPAVALALALPVVCLLRPRPHPLERVHLRQAAVGAVMRCQQAGDLVQVGSAEEAWTFVALGGHPARLSIGEPPEAPSRRWIVAGTEVCARGMSEGTCGLSLCPPPP
jgi:hypothetical protein